MGSSAPCPVSPESQTNSIRNAEFHRVTIKGRIHFRPFLLPERHFPQIFHHQAKTISAAAPSCPPPSFPQKRQPLPPMRSSSLSLMAQPPSAPAVTKKQNRPQRLCRNGIGPNPVLPQAAFSLPPRRKVALSQGKEMTMTAPPGCGTRISSALSSFSCACSKKNITFSCKNRLL